MRDCADGLLEQRIDELAAEGLVKKGTALVTSHLALEHLARVHISRQLTMHDPAAQLADEKRLLTGLEKLRKYVVRIEIPEREGRTAHRFLPLLLRPVGGPARTRFER